MNMMSSRDSMCCLLATIHLLILTLLILTLLILVILVTNKVEAGCHVRVLDVLVVVRLGRIFGHLLGDVHDDPPVLNRTDVQSSQGAGSNRVGNVDEVVWLDFD